eukprot:7074743-Prymnesium_polylepis.1
MFSTSPGLMRIVGPTISLLYARVCCVTAGPLYVYTARERLQLTRLLVELQTAGLSSAAPAVLVSIDCTGVSSKSSSVDRG